MTWRNHNFKWTTHPVSTFFLDALQDLITNGRQIFYFLLGIWQPSYNTACRIQLLKMSMRFKSLQSAEGRWVLVYEPASYINVLITFLWIHGLLRSGQSILLFNLSSVKHLEQRFCGFYTEHIFQYWSYQIYLLRDGNFLADITDINEKRTTIIFFTPDEVNIYCTLKDH